MTFQHYAQVFFESISSATENRFVGSPTIHSRECPRRNSPHDQASYLDLRRWAIRQMSYFVVGQEANVEAPCAAAGGGAVLDQRRDNLNRGRVTANRRRPV
ncbi:hypothetical protein QA649_33605 [Bradyrhizobium sp. CB1717]|uniref:hypothetical protein n=1 Tax=Bradyrhizobium sp. CB1717 TaxID=3039154 RepID=UPI0024B1B71A|nr:hypothetical protein [Bradyrhizobium sp. CB1717]WFU22981.1 hypothetical protein QA649_33605 [Bradyrhizobium sp. CB1717]